MAESDRERLLARALALPQAEPSDFFGDRRPPADAEAALVKRIADTSLRTKLVDARLAEGLQSPKGPQKIASIVRVYPDFDAPRRAQPNSRAPAGRTRAAAAKAQPAAARGLPSVAEMEHLIARIREVEREVGGELSAAVDEQIESLKRSLAELSDGALEAAHAELGAALTQKRALAQQIRLETFRRIEGDAGFAPRIYLRLLRR